MVRSLANVIFKRIWARLLLLRERALLEEANAKKQKEDRQEKQMANLALSAREQIQQQVEKDLEPKLDKLLAQKIKPQAIRKKETVFRKERNVKFGASSSSSKSTSRKRTLHFRINR